MAQKLDYHEWLRTFGHQHRTVSLRCRLETATPSHQTLAVFVGPNESSRTLAGRLIARTGEAREIEARLRYSPFDLASQAIELFLEYRDTHGKPEDEARGLAALEVAEGAAVTDEEIGR